MVVSRFVNWWFLMIIVYISVLLSKLHILFSFVRAFDSRAIFFLLLSLFPSIIFYFAAYYLKPSIWSQNVVCVRCVHEICVRVSFLLFFCCAVIFFYLRWCSLLSIHFLSLYPCAITAWYCWCCCCYFFGCCFKTQALIMSAICAV